MKLLEFYNHFYNNATSKIPVWYTVRKVCLAMELNCDSNQLYVCSGSWLYRARLSQAAWCRLGPQRLYIHIYIFFSFVCKWAAQVYVCCCGNLVEQGGWQLNKSLTRSEIAKGRKQKGHSALLNSLHRQILLSETFNEILKGSFSTKTMLLELSYAMKLQFNLEARYLVGIYTQKSSSDWMVSLLSI